MEKILVIGAGLAGCEAAAYLARHGLNIVLAESKKLAPNPSQKIPLAAELVCTNSLKSLKKDSAHGLLKSEMARLGSIVLQASELSKVPAGDALAVDRQIFSEQVERILATYENIKRVDLVVDDPLATAKEFGCSQVIIATGPLTTGKLGEWVAHNLSKDDLYFYDAIAPVVDADSLDLSKLYWKDRWGDDKEEADYLNCPLDKEQYLKFVDDIVNSQKVLPQNFEKEQFFEACLPIDVMAARGVETLRFGCMKPIGLMMPNGNIPHAVIQLRKENLLGKSFNLVGFQNRLKYGDQLQLLKSLPGFENASFHHLGSVHRNTFIHAKKLLNNDLSTKTHPQVFFAGQITGVEGYTESASLGLYVAHQIVRRKREMSFQKWPVESGIGALINYIMTSPRPVPSNINFGLLPEVKLTKEQRKGKIRKTIKKSLAVERANIAFSRFLEEHTWH
jgi:methylenetetrahydrofolate--tRNA-(uracil-5-)-methyltransferase